MKPTVGRIVWCFDYAGVPMPAIVTGTYATPPDAVDLTVFPRNSEPGVKICAVPGTGPGNWIWPPREATT